MNRRILILGAAVLAGMTVLLFVKGKQNAASDIKPAIDANVVEFTMEAQKNAGLVVKQVSEQLIHSTVKTTGIVSADQSRVAHIFPLAKGVVEKVYVQLGDKVSEGQPIILYDNIELGQLIGQFLSLRGGLEKVRAQQEVAGKSLDRASALIEIQAISQSEFDLRQAEYDQAKAAVQSQLSDVASVEEQLHRYGLSEQEVQDLGGPAEHGSHRTASHNLVKAPLNGVVINFDVSQGEVVDPGKELMTVIDTSEVWILADVYDKDLAAVRTGGEARITVASYPGQTFTGRITYVSALLDPASRTVKVRCVAPNGDGRLKLEMFANVEIPAVGTRRAMAVPEDAIQQVDGEPVIFIQRDATHYEKRAIQTGERGDDWVEVVKGVDGSEKIVTKGSFYVKTGLLREQIGGGE